uniref:cAMP-dependent protein kinase inhibitor gamma isoform X1 n=1 Tax=Geotrypetes seraphini TaxID=260995 RepID=A0A6P8NJ58_GEOSA|nr:cAMP-dependent protein kinase inhibitor gamma isoform X1 [Geotrypetes seraphini]
MPKRRGRSAAGASRRSGPAAFGNIDELLRRMQDMTAVSVDSPLEAWQRGEVQEISLGLETTLNHDARAPPQQPHTTSSPREGMLPGNGGHSTPEAREIHLESRSSGSHFLQESLNLENEDLTSTGARSSQTIQRQEELAAGEQFELTLQHFLPQKPHEVTLESLWELISNLGKTFYSQFQQIEGKIKNHDSEIGNLKKELEVSKSLTNNLQEDMGLSKKLQETLIKDNTNLRRKIELLENFSRNNNLRLINSPKVPMITPREMLKRYLQEILEIPESSLPPFAQVYYLPTKTRDTQHVANQEPIDISAVLESSDRVVDTRTYPR